MKKTLITREHFKIMPWKNGSGVTAEIDIEPKGVDFREGNFEWRLSSARIEDENQFSRFPGYDRILTVLSGEGLLLNSQELGPFEIFEFQGEDPVDCALIENPVEDLGLIFKREKYKCSMQILDVTGPMYLKLEKGTHFFLSLSGQANVAGSELQPPDFLKIEETPAIEITAKIYPIHLLMVQIGEK
ncbi:MAG: HutD family protein [Pseudobdellovibrionaceae bacterium]